LISLAGVTETSTETQVFVALPGVAYAADPACTTTGLRPPVPSRSETVIAPGVAVSEPGVVELTVTVQVPPTVPVLHVGTPTSFDRSESVTAMVVPSGTATNPLPSPRSCSTETVNSCAVPARFVALGAIDA